MNQILPDATVTTEAPIVHVPETLRSPERILSTIAATARLDGMAAPRRISFDESTPTTPLAVLSLTWLSLADMRPWLAFFAAAETHTYRREDGTAHYTAYADYYGWSLMLNALDTERCTCGAERVHLIGCPADGAKQCPATWYGGWCPGEVRHDDGRCDTHTSHNLTYDEPIPSLPVEPTAEMKAFNDAHAVGTVVDYWRGVREGEPSGRGVTSTSAQVLSGHTAVVWIEGCSGCIALSHVRAVFNLDAAEQIPVLVVDIPHLGEPYGREANTQECARLNARVGATLDQMCADDMMSAPLKGAYDSPAVRRAIHESIHGATPSEPVDDGDTFTDETIAHRHEPVPVVDVLTVDPDLTDEGRGGAGVARIGVPIDLTAQTMFAQAPERLQTARDDATFAQIVETS